MPASWVQPIFIYSIIYNFASYIILASIFFLIYKKNIINRKYLFINFIFLLTPFLFNGFLFDWSLFPDQSKYLNLAYELRQNPSTIFSYGINKISDFKILFSSSIFAFSPLISVETYTSIALYNRFLFLLTLVFLLKKKYLNSFDIIFFIITPSIMLYSSLVLRDSLLIILMLWFIYFFYEKKYFFLFLTSIILIILRNPILFTILIFFLANSCIKNDRINYTTSFVSVITVTVILFLFKEQITNLLNFLRFGFFSEEYGQYQSAVSDLEYENFKLDFSFKSIPLALTGFFKFLLPPFFKGKTNFFYFILLLENLFIFIYIYLKIKFQKNNNLFILFKWFLIYFISYFIYSLIVFNDATMHRYKIPILFFVIFGYFVNVKKEKI